MKIYLTFMKLKRNQKDELIASIWVYFYLQIAFIKKIHACIQLMYKYLL